MPLQDREPLRGYQLETELRMTEVMVSAWVVMLLEGYSPLFQVLISVMKWCWARLPGGVVTWEVYEGFRVGEKGNASLSDLYMIHADGLRFSLCARRLQPLRPHRRGLVCSSADHSGLF
jgi:hypothetical protein